MRSCLNLRARAADTGTMKQVPSHPVHVVPGDQVKKLFAVDLNKRLQLTMVVDGDKGWQSTGGMVTELSKDRLGELKEEGYVQFDDKGGGEFHFGYVHGDMDCRLTTRDGEPAVEWTWDGNDEMDPAQGRGWAVVKGEELHGMIFFHGGDDSEFVAKKAKEGKRKKGK